MRGYEEIIQQAELTIMPPELVAEFLKLRAGQSWEAKCNDQNLYDPVDEQAEQALRGRNDPLIDLALARYGRNINIVSELFHAANPGSAIRMACLSNQAIDDTWNPLFLQFPLGLMNGEPDQMAVWLQSASNNELHALFQNTSLSDTFLCDLLNRSGSWNLIDDDKLCGFVSMLRRNSRLRTPRQSSFIDGWTEHKYNSVFDAAWKLAETAPTTEEWANALGPLYEVILPVTSTISDPLALADRWREAPSTVTSEQGHQADYLGQKERVRKGLARLALSKNRDLLPELLSSADIAFRASAYAFGDLNAAEIRAAYERDGPLACYEAIENTDLWRRRPTRWALHEISWGVTRNDKHSNFAAVNRFNWIMEDTRKRNPDWFADEEESEIAQHDDVETQALATKEQLDLISNKINQKLEKLSELVDIMKQNSQIIEQYSQIIKTIDQATQSLMSYARWVFILSLGALLASLWRL
jgi:hypothetical protein